MRFQRGSCLWLAYSLSGDENRNVCILWCRLESRKLLTCGRQMVRSLKASEESQNACKARVNLLLQSAQRTDSCSHDARVAFSTPSEYDRLHLRYVTCWHSGDSRQTDGELTTLPVIASPRVTLGCPWSLQHRFGIAEHSYSVYFTLGNRSFGLGRWDFESPPTTDSHGLSKPRGQNHNTISSDTPTTD